MSEADNKFKQRIIGALVLIALAVIFLPMLFPGKEEHPLPRVEVPAPPAPVIPPVPETEVEPVVVPEPVEDNRFEPVPEPELEFVLIENDPAERVERVERVERAERADVPAAPDPVATRPAVESSAADKPVAAEPPAPAQTKKPAREQVASKPAGAQERAEPGIDRSNLPVSWSIQLASLSSLANAERLRDTYRAKHYAAYVRSSEGVHKVLIGPLIREAEAVAMCKQLKARDKQDCFVVRYQP